MTCQMLQMTKCHHPVTVLTAISRLTPRWMLLERSVGVFTLVCTLPGLKMSPLGFLKTVPDLCPYSQSKPTPTPQKIGTHPEVLFDSYLKTNFPHIEVTCYPQLQVKLMTFINLPESNTTSNFYPYPNSWLWIRALVLNTFPGWVVLNEIWCVPLESFLQFWLILIPDLTLAP